METDVANAPLGYLFPVELSVAASISIMFLNLKVALVIEQPVQHVSCISISSANHLNVKRGILVRNMSVEHHAWF